MTILNKKLVEEAAINHSNTMPYDNDYESFIAGATYVEEKAKNYIDKVESILKNLRLDAEMALDDRWDRSDDGFQCQIDIIDEFLKEKDDVK